MISRLGAARSFLFVPGDRPDRFEKALQSGADVVVLDLEDAVAPAVKDNARDHVVNLLLQAPVCPVVVRVNHPSTAWGPADLLVLRSVPDLDGVMIPKAGSREQLEGVSKQLDGLAILPIIETAAGLLAAPAIATATGVERLILGHLDLAAELGLDPADDTRLAPARFALVVASAAADLPSPVDGVSTHVRDVGRIRAETRSALAAGYLARLCIHPDQIAVVHEALAPDDAQVEWAQSVVASAGIEGVTVLDGEMVDPPVMRRAHSMLARAGRLP